MRIPRGLVSFSLLSCPRTVTQWVRCTNKHRQIGLTEIEARGSFLLRSAIFLILKIGLPNIDSPPIALRKIPGDWGLFAEMHIASHKGR
jgi:hypothetical protein